MTDKPGMGEREIGGLVDQAKPARDFAAAPDLSRYDGSIDGICAGYPCTDLGNAERFVMRHGENLIFVAQAGWLNWDGKRWNGISGPDAALLAAQDTSRSIVAEVTAANAGRDSNRAAVLKKWQVDSEAYRAITASVRLAEPTLRRQPDQMDQARSLLTVGNGTLELGAQVLLRESRREDLLTRLVPTNFEDARAPIFQGFLEKVMPDENMRRFLQSWFGYSLTGDTSEQVIAFLYGRGSNGKSTLIACIDRVIGDLHATVPIASLLKDDRRRGSEATPDIARLPGVRFLTSSEPEVGARLSDSVIKQMTGGEKIAVRNLHQGFFEFDPQFKITVSCNNRPIVTGQDEGIWRRILLVPFEERVNRDDVGPVYEALEAEAPGILAWLIQGAERWFEAGLEIPEGVRTATAAYRTDYDATGEFLKSWCIVGADAGGSSTRAGLLWEAWRTWCRENGENAGSQRTFGLKLTERGIKKTKIGTMFYTDIQLNEAAEEGLKNSPAVDD